MSEFNEPVRRRHRREFRHRPETTKRCSGRRDLSWRWQGAKDRRKSLPPLRQASALAGGRRHPRTGPGRPGFACRVHRPRRLPGTQRRHRPARRRPGQPGVRAAVAGQRRRGAEHLSVLSRQTSKPTSVVFIGTFLQPVTFPGLAAYIASKAALIAQARTLAVEWAEKGVRINLVSPRPYRHPDMGVTGPERCPGGVCHPEHQPAPGRRQPLSPGEIVDVVMFLLSSKSAGLYGQELIVDKGYGLR
ncbi:SDR family oxidoreductase [Pseudomonas aeruginosa]